MPTFTYEKRFWSEGIQLVAGVDEVGMGALAGPVVAAAVVFKDGNFFDEPVVRDSKTMSAKQRARAAEWIRNTAVAWAVGESSVDDISRLNVRNASHLAMWRAVEDLNLRPHMLLIDGTPAQPHAAIPAECIIDGDSHCFSIAAASIVAKEHRDEIMRKIDEEFPGYALASNKGYGSKAHKEALERLGATPHHRPTYAPVAATLTK